MTDTVLNHVKQHTALLDGFLSEAVHEFGKAEVMDKVEALKDKDFDFGSLSESEAAHAARIMTCMSMLSVISEDVGQLGQIDTFESADGSMQPISLANAVEFGAQGRAGPHRDRHHSGGYAGFPGLHRPPDRDAPCLGGGARNRDRQPVAGL
ncbi:hypothetical protein [Asticcacaulis sp. MM231]|uniref:hypothetical protein n=1 Tax=Asticcacaulis sp. MM231 TaxID=3157666 RepID=UPI0032D59170